MTRAFVDANVIFAAAISPDGRSAQLLDAPSEHTLLASEHVIEEARRNIALRYPACMERLRDVILPRLVVVGEPPPDVVSWAAEHGLPDTDAPVLGAAAQVGADVLVTGDRTHFGELFGKRLRGVEVITLREAVERLGEP